MKSNTLRRLFAYTLRYKWSFLVSIFGFLTFAAADIAAVDKVVLNFTAAKQKQVIRDITQAINGLKFGDGFITVADDENSVYLSSNITSCGAITVTAAA